MPRRARGTNYIDVPNALQMFIEGYSLKARAFNHYQIRISHEEADCFYDWYHTTGSLCWNANGICRKIAQITNPEDVAIFIKNDLEKNYG